MEIVVRPGDTFWLYSQWFQIPLILIEDANPGILPEHLSIGQRVRIPGFRLTRYTLRSGEQFGDVARRNRLPLEALSLVNPDLIPEEVREGQGIYVPVRITYPIVHGQKEYDFSTLENDLQQLAAIYPFMQVEPIGSSVLGKPLYEIRLGRGVRVIHFNGSFHANEWITTPVLMQILNTFLLSLTNQDRIRGVETLSLYQNNTLSIVPMVNPDGVDLVIHGPPPERREEVLAINGWSQDFSNWKANIRGVDLNNQFPANWEIEKARKEPKRPAPRDYPGDAPLSEPEANAMAKLAQERQFARLFAFHTQGKEFYWGYEGLEPPESVHLAREIARVSKYRSIRYIDSHAGYRDWFIMIYRRPGFTMELGLGVNPLPLSQFPEMYEEMLGVFLVALYL